MYIYIYRVIMTEYASSKNTSLKHVSQLLSSKVPNAVNRAIYIYSVFLTRATIIAHYTVLVSWINSNLQMAAIYLVFLKKQK